ncbi:hypothetical protein JTE90_006933 [Oedothorax gibbosus]|uniref:Uncharacterized protein n=1 Tax=Oedothorax gibbosus TaxID=931172 RepID=A0AAV6VQ48_9ARAC|nr:hypothetical protein JTE90_006933 [Oedothorax gibbosus]
MQYIAHISTIKRQFPPFLEICLVFTATCNASITEPATITGQGFQPQLVLGVSLNGKNFERNGAMVGPSRRGPIARGQSLLSSSRIFVSSIKLRGWMQLVLSGGHRSNPAEGPPLSRCR